MVGRPYWLNGHELEQFGSWWWTGKPGVLQSIGSQGVRHDWTTEWNWTMCCWRKFLRAPWTAKRSNQSILKEINPEYLLEGMMLKMKLQYFGHLIRTADSLEKTLILGRIEGRRKGQQDEMVGRHHQFNGHELGQTLGYGDGQESLVCCSPWGCKESTRLGDWTTTATIHTHIYTHTPIQWTWTWANSWIWWWTGKPGVL